MYQPETDFQGYFVKYLFKGSYDLTLCFIIYTVTCNGLLPVSVV